MRTKALSVATCCMCFFLSALFPLASAGQSADQAKPEHFSATVFGQSGMSLGKSAVLNIYVNGYTSDQEVEQLAATLKDGGSDALLSAIQKMKEKGRVSVTGKTGWAVSVVRQHPTDKGRKIVMFSDRPIGFYEATTAPRSKQYQFGLLILNINDKGTGDGLLYGACKVKFTKDDQLEMEYFSTAPARLIGVKVWK